MDKAEYAFTVLRLSLLENFLLQNESFKKKYLEDINLLKFIIEKENQPDSEKILSLISNYIASINQIPTK